MWLIIFFSFSILNSNFVKCQDYGERRNHGPYLLLAFVMLISLSFLACCLCCIFESVCGEPETTTEVHEAPREGT